MAFRGLGNVLVPPEIVSLNGPCLSPRPWSSFLIHDWISARFAVSAAAPLIAPDNPDHVDHESSRSDDPERNTRVPSDFTALGTTLRNLAESGVTVNESSPEFVRSTALVVSPLTESA